MSTNGVRNGTSLAGDWLCRSCSHALIQKGYSESEEQVSCAYGYWEIPRPLPFKVRECSGYADQRLSGYSGMEEIAWSLRSMSAGRQPGFIAVTESDKGKNSK
jgi:hypothetical protein